MSWSSRGLRGSTFEELLNLTNDRYMEKGLAVIQKISTPITPLKFDSVTRTITLAYFEQKSTVDYIGVVQGIPVCFDAKETSRNCLPFDNIHEHQINFMDSFEKHKGVSFLLVHFAKEDEYFYLPFTQLKQAWYGAKSGGRKSIPYKDFDRDLIFGNKDGFITHYLMALNEYLKKSDK